MPLIGSFIVCKKGVFKKLSVIIALSWKSPA